MITALFYTAPRIRHRYGHHAVLSEDVEVPKGVVYKTVDQATDQKARKSVVDAFAGGGPNILLLCTSSIVRPRLLGDDQG